MRIFLRLIFLSLFLFFSINPVYAGVDYEEVKYRQYMCRIEMAEYYNKEGKTDKALEQYESADKLLSRPATKFFIARTLFLAKDYKNAEARVNEAIAQYVQCQCVDFFYINAFMLKADLLEMRGDTEGAIRHFTFVLFAAENKQMAQLVMGRIANLEKALAKRVNI